MSKVHVVNHTHWDREWYFTTMDALVLSENCFTEILDELERNPHAKFCLDGQSSILDDYVQIRPQRFNQIKKFVKQKRLSIGPWYTQTDTFFVNAESIIRNLILGIRDCKKYGDYMNIGYLPDTFGFNAQMPTILQNCGIDNIIFFRGINFQKHVTSPYFKWKGLSEKEIIAINLVNGYGIAAFLEESHVYIQNKLIPITQKIKSLSKQDEILIPVGEDQLDIINNLEEKLNYINKKTKDHYEVSSYEDFTEYLRKQKSLENYEGEFREPCLSRVHKTIGSIRYDIKRLNFIIEQKLLNRIEPLIAIAKVNKIDISEKLLHAAWKKILEGQAHDGMGGCVSDNVAIDILHRMKEANEIADSIENLILKRLSQQINLQENQIIVFNTLPIPFKGCKKVDFISRTRDIRLKTYDNAIILKTEYYKARENIRTVTSEGEKYITEPEYYKITMLVNIQLPSMGYRVIEFEEKQNSNISELEVTDNTIISNNHYKIEFKNNKLELTTSFGKKITDFISFEDCGNDGDTYDFSPLAEDKPLILSLSLNNVLKNSIMEVMNLSGKFNLPYKLEDRLKEDGKKNTLSIELSIILIKDSPLIDFKCKVDNQIYSHRLRTRINTDILAKETIASLPFGYIKRQVLNNEPKDWHNEYVEIPIDIEPYDASVSVQCEQYNFTAFAKGMKEYQFIKNNLYLTLFSTTSELGKEDLVYRPGRASGDTTKKGHIMIKTPMAELIGTNIFEFAININEGKFNEYQTTKYWQDYTSEHISYQMQSLNKFMHRLDNKIQLREKIHSSPCEFSLLQINEEVFFSSISPSLYDENAFLLRLKNPTKYDKLLNNYDFSKFRRVVKVNYIEEICENQDLYVKAYDTLTLKLWL